MGSDTDDVIDNLFDTVIQIFHEAIETSERGSELIHESLYCVIIFRKQT